MNAYIILAWAFVVGMLLLIVGIIVNLSSKRQSMAAVSVKPVNHISTAPRQWYQSPVTVTLSFLFIVAALIVGVFYSSWFPIGLLQPSYPENPTVTYKVWCSNCSMFLVNYIPENGQQTIGDYRPPWKISFTGKKGDWASVFARPDSGIVYCSIEVNGIEVTNNGSALDVVCKAQVR